MGHNQLNVLILKTGGINLFPIIFFILVLLIITSVNGLALVVGVVVTGVIVASVIVSLLRSQLLSGGCLSLGVQILDLSLTEDAMGLIRICFFLWGKGGV